ARGPTPRHLPLPGEPAGVSDLHESDLAHAPQGEPAGRDHQADLPPPPPPLLLHAPARGGRRSAHDPAPPRPPLDPLDGPLHLRVADGPRARHESARSPHRALVLARRVAPRAGLSARPRPHPPSALRCRRHLPRARRGLPPRSPALSPPAPHHARDLR